MAVDTPASIAIVGAGPIGLEAALYARYLGYDVQIYERSPTAVSRLLESDRFVTWREGISPLGIAALAAQTPGWQPPDPTATMTARELVQLYYSPLVHSDLLADCLRLRHEVLSIERDVAPGDEPPDEDELTGFRLRVRSIEGERTDQADIVFDVSGHIDPGQHDPLWFGALPSAGAEKPQEFSPTDPQRLLTLEPDFYILGAKSAAPGVDFRLVDGLAQIRDLFTIIADRADLDLYATVHGAF